MRFLPASNMLLHCNLQRYIGNSPSGVSIMLRLLPQ